MWLTDSGGLVAFTMAGVLTAIFYSRWTGQGRAAKSLLWIVLAAPVLLGRFSAAAVGRNREAGGYAILDIDLHGDQPGRIRDAGVYRGSAGTAKLVCLDPPGGNQHADVLFADVYPFCYFEYVAGQLEITRRIKER